MVKSGKAMGVVLVRLSLGGSFEGEASLATGAGP
jgi:hypothetical protein